GANDNVGIKSVSVEYKINGIAQESVQLENNNNDYYSGKIQFGEEYINKLEYRIIAVDNTARENKRSFPATGFQQVKIYSLNEPVTGYHTDFNNAANDFMVSDFHISTLNGFSDN